MEMFSCDQYANSDFKMSCFSSLRVKLYENISVSVLKLRSMSLSVLR